MANYCVFTIKAAGPDEQLQAIRANWDGMLRDFSKPDQNGFVGRWLDFSVEYPILPKDTRRPYYDQDYMGCNINNGLLNISAISNWEPPHDFMSAMSARWPEVEFVVSCTIEHERYETWHFQAGDISIIELWLDDIQAHEDEESERWYVRDGVLLVWPEWHPIQWKETVFLHALPEWVIEEYEPSCDDGQTLEEMEEAVDKIVGEVE